MIDLRTSARVDVDGNGAQATTGAFFPSISDDGRFVAFDSSAANLVPGDTNTQRDVFVVDRQSGAIERVSLANGGGQADSFSSLPYLSNDGRFVAFESLATNLVPNDTNGVRDVFVFDRQTDTIERVSVGPGGAEANNFSFVGAISGNGRFVLFSSGATNLVPNDTNGQFDAFVFDRQTHVTERVSVGNGGVQANSGSFGNSISDDGRFVAFTSDATNLVPNDTGGFNDIFVYDRQTATVECVSVAADGTLGNDASFVGTLSADGRLVAFASLSTNLVPNDTNGQQDVFVVDRQTDVIERISVGNGGVQADGSSGGSHSFSSDGRFVTFSGTANNLVPNDTNGFAIDSFVFDRQTQTIGRVLASDGSQVDDADFAVISGNGRVIAFQSFGANLVPNDTNGNTDVFVAEIPTLTVGDAAIAEGNSGSTNLTFTISLSAATFAAVTVTATTANGTATAGSDYTAKSQTVTIPGGQTSASFTVALAGDAVVEPNETFTVTLSNPGNAVIATAGTTATGTITNDDATLTIANAQIVEGNSGANNLVFTITRAGATSQPATVTASTADGTAAAGIDYTAASGTVTIAAGQASATFAVPVLGDVLNEADETFTVALSNPVGATLGAPSSATGTIVNDDAPPVLSIADAATTEGNVNLVFTISLSAAATQAVSVTASTLNGAALAGADYTATSALVTIPAGQTSATFSVPLLDDAALEIDEAFLVRLSAPTGGATISTIAGTAKGTILDLDTAALPTIDGQTVNGTAGDDFLVASALNDSVRGEGGADTEFGNERSDVLLGGAGNDFILGDFPGNFLDGEADVIDAGDGNDNVFGGGGNDTIFGGNGDDLIGGDFGDNLIFGGNGNNALIGFGGADSIEGGNDGDIVFGLSGPDVISTRGGFDLIIAGGDLDGPTDADFIDVAEGGSSVFAGAGDDTILAGAGNDFMLGESGADLMLAGAGNDVLIAGPGNDTLEGGAGDDVIIPEGGDDSITGGPGADLFRYPGGIAVDADRIGDFTPADDTFELDDSLGFATAAQALAAVTQQGADAVLNVTGGSITFVGLNAATLTAADFVIV